MAEHRFRQVTWNIPDELYRRFRELHDWAQKTNFASIPKSEQDFAVVMFDDAVSRGESVRDAYEKDGNLIVDPFAKRPTHTPHSVKTGAHLIV